MSATPLEVSQANTGPKHPVLIFLSANFVYLWLVHASALWAPMSERDAWEIQFARSLNERAGRWTSWFSMFCDYFSDAAFAYRLFNILALYLCMVGIFFLTRAVVKGPWWLGSVAAVLTMANPLKTEAILSVSGADLWVSSVLAVWGVLLAVWPFQREPRAMQLIGAFLIFMAVYFHFGNNLILLVGCPAVVLCLRLCSVGYQAVSFSCWAIYSLLLLRLIGMAEQINFASILHSLFFTLYPIGLLPGTVSLFAAHPLLASGSAYCVFVCWLLVYAATRNRAVFWCGVAAFALRLGAEPIDSVSMQGGESMLLPIACIAIGFAAVCQSVMRHPQWPRHVVFLTTVLCLVFFGLQIHAIKTWTRTPAPTAKLPAMKTNT